MWLILEAETIQFMSEKLKEWWIIPSLDPKNSIKSIDQGLTPIRFSLKNYNYQVCKLFDLILI